MGENAKFVDYYKLLDIPTAAEPALIRLAYIRLAKLHHPDAGGTTAGMQRLNNAYRTLMSGTSRKAYDMMHGFNVGKTTTNYRINDDETDGASIDDLSDEEIDEFLNGVYAEYHNQPKPKKTFMSRIKDMF